MGEGRLVVVVPPIRPNVFASPGLPTLARLDDESLLGSKVDSSSRARSALAAAARFPIDLEARREGVPGPPRRMEVGAMEEKADLVGVLRSKTQESRERAVVVVGGLGALLERKRERKRKGRRVSSSSREERERDERRLENTHNFSSNGLGTGTYDLLGTLLAAAAGTDDLIGPAISTTPSISAAPPP